MPPVWRISRKIQKQVKEARMQAKETIQTHSETAVPRVAENGEPSALRAWQTPAFTRLPLKEALSAPSGNGNDGFEGYYS